MAVTDLPMSKRMRECYLTIKDAKSGEICGWSIAKWLNTSLHPEGVKSALRGLTNRGLVIMRPMENPPVEFPNRLLAMYSISKEDANGK